MEQSRHTGWWIILALSIFTVACGALTLIAAIANLRDPLGSIVSLIGKLFGLSGAAGLWFSLVTYMDRRRERSGTYPQGRRSIPHP